MTVKHVGWGWVSFLIALGATIALLALGMRGASHPTDPHLNELTTNQRQFISECSGVDVREEPVAAYVSCMARIRGFSDGHIVTSAITGSQSMWCIPKSTTDGAVFTAVLGWVDTSPNSYNHNIQADIPTTTMMAASIALSQAFPCSHL